MCIWTLTSMFIYQALTEICNLAKAIQTRRGDEFIDFLLNVYFPSINCPTNLANDFIQGLQTQETKQFRKYLEVSPKGGAAVFESLV
jgi:exportin-T